MTNLELINTLRQYDMNLPVLVDADNVLKVCCEEGYLRIITEGGITDAKGDK